jgi:hypothetical protein
MNVSLLLLPVSLPLRALDDLHTIAEAARSLPRVEEALTARIEELDERLAAVLEVAERIEGGLPSIERVLASIDTLGDAAGTLAMAAGPLQGAAERLGRVADRLPGGARARSA